MYGMKQPNLNQIITSKSNHSNQNPATITTTNTNNSRISKSSKVLQSLNFNKSNTTPNFNKKKEKENENVDKFKNSSVLKSATENLFLSNNLSSGNNKAHKNVFSNTTNFPETVISLHNSINSNPIEKNTQKDNLKYSHTSDPFKGTNYNYSSGQNDLSSLKIYPILVTPQLNRMTHIDSENYRDKQAINLEDLYIGEEKLWGILESLRYNSSVSFACEDYFEFLNMTSLNSMENYFSHYDTKQALSNSNVLEIVSTMSVLVSVFKNKLNSEGNITHLKNLIFNVHQNFLVMVKLILSRLPKEFESNMWATRLFAIVQNKQVKFFNNQDLFTLKQNNNIVLNCVSKYVSANFRLEVQIFEVMMDVLGNLERYTYSTVKNILLNIVRDFELIIYYVFLEKFAYALFYDESNFDELSCYPCTLLTTPSGR